MAESRRKRGDIYDPEAPRFYYTKPNNPPSPQKNRGATESCAQPSVYKEPPPVPTGMSVKVLLLLLPLKSDFRDKPLFFSNLMFSQSRVKTSF